MRLYTILADGKKEVAVEREGRIYPVSELGYAHTDMVDLIRHAGEAEMKELRAFAAGSGTAEGPAGFLPSEVTILAPIEHPEQEVMCVGVNYYSHIEETVFVEDMREKEATVYFSKRADRVLGPEGHIPDYDFVDKLDYEVELAVVIGRDTKGYRQGAEEDPVFGYSVFNDISARNLQFKHKQWYVGKSLDGYTAMGPCIVTPDEIGDPQDLDLFCRVNGEMRQSSNTSLMIQPVHAVIEELSRGITLRAGTVIATGTPGGVALGMPVPKYLKAGDRVECGIEKIGILANTVG